MQDPQTKEASDGLGEKDRHRTAGAPKPALLSPLTSAVNPFATPVREWRSFVSTQEKKSRRDSHEYIEDSKAKVLDKL